MTIRNSFPDVRPALNLDFANTKRLDPRITFTRGSTGTYVDEFGVIKTAASNEARFDHDGDGNSLGLLIEESRTNEILNSQVFTSGYNKSGINTITQDTTVTTPEGLTDGVGVITESSGGTVHQFYEASSAQITGIRTYSIFVKPNGRNYCVLMTSSFTHDLVNGTTLGSASGEYVSATTTKFPNGWVRCTLTRNHSNTYDQFNFKLAKDGLNDYSYSGDGVSGAYVWGAQIEVGSFPTSYIPTSGSTATRSADVASMTGTNFSSWYNQSEGTIIATQQDISSGTGYDIVWGFGTGGSNRIELRQRSGEFKRGFYINGTNISSADLLYTKSNHVDSYTVGVAIDANGVDQAAEGTLLTTKTFTNATMPTISALYFSTGSGYFDRKHLSRFTYYDRRLTDAQLQALTL